MEYLTIKEALRFFQILTTLNYVSGYGRLFEHICIIYHNGGSDLHFDDISKDDLWSIFKNGDLFARKFEIRLNGNHRILNKYYFENVIKKLQKGERP